MMMIIIAVLICRLELEELQAEHAGQIGWWRWGQEFVAVVVSRRGGAEVHLVSEPSQKSPWLVHSKPFPDEPLMIFPF